MAISTGRKHKETRKSSVAKSAKRDKNTMRTRTVTRRKKREKKRSFLCGMIMAVFWLMLVAFIAIGVYIWYCYTTLPDLSKAMYIERQPGVKILAADGRELTSYGALFAEPADVKKLPKYVAQAVVDTEDRRFYKHSGFDYIGFIRAMGVNVIKHRYAQGASTITQQVAKNLFLTSEKSIRRKVQEFLLAAKLEKHFTKDQILNIYLNRVFFGSGAYGINAAAKRFFNKTAKELNLREAAILAGSLKAPSRYNYLKNKRASLERSEVVLSLMLRAGSISLKEWESAIALPIGNANNEAITDIRYFGDYIMGDLSSLVSQNNQDIYVKTTLDYSLQRRAEYILRKHLRANRAKNVTQGAIVILDRMGAVKAMVGGSDYNRSQFNRATQALRQAGSGFKLFVYLTALEDGFSPDSRLADEPIRIDDWEPQNYDKRVHGSVTMKQAFAQSFNLATVDLATNLNLEDIIDMAKRLGITSEIKAEPSIVLGAAEVRVIDMAAAYTAIANGGYAVFPYAVTDIKNREGKVLYTHKPAIGEKVLSVDVVQKMGMMERLVVSEGTGKKARHIAGARGKTGTSQNYRDAWFIGTAGKYTAAVWVGNDDNTPMKEVGGGNLPTEIWAEIMK